MKNSHQDQNDIDTIMMVDERRHQSVLVDPRRLQQQRMAYAEAHYGPVISEDGLLRR